MTTLDLGTWMHSKKNGSICCCHVQEPRSKADQVSRCIQQKHSSSPAKYVSPFQHPIDLPSSRSWEPLVSCKVEVFVPNSDNEPIWCSQKSSNIWQKRPPQNQPAVGAPPRRKQQQPAQHVTVKLLVVVNFDDKVSAKVQRTHQHCQLAGNACSWVQIIARVSSNEELRRDSAMLDLFCTFPVGSNASTKCFQMQTNIPGWLQ